MFTRFENLFLYLICTLTWGSTWLVITFQVDSAPATTSVFWRFLIASSSIFLFLLVKKKHTKYPLQSHYLFGAQGVFMFSINYILTYLAETKVTSGLIALTFTSLVYFNIFGLRIYFKKPISSRVLWGSLIGGLGIALIFANELKNLNTQSASLIGLGLGFLATFSASTGNMIAQMSFQRKIPVSVTNAYGMLYGALFTLVIIFVQGESLNIPLTPKYLTSLLYLAIMGTAIAFGAYLTLAERIGAEKASYSNIMSPLIALILSSVFEEFHWTPIIFAGVLLCLMGNFLTLTKAAD